MIFRALRSSAASALIALSCCCSGCTIGVGVLAAAQPYYSPGELARDHGDGRHAVTTVGCLDLAIDLAAEPTRTVLEWRMGNRCNEVVATDLSRIVASTGDGASRTPVALVDPNGELSPHDLAPRRDAFERIALRLDGTQREVCIDATHVVANGAGAGAAPACFVFTDRWTVRKERGS